MFPVLQERTHRIKVVLLNALRNVQDGAGRKPVAAKEVVDACSSSASIAVPERMNLYQATVDIRRHRTDLVEEVRMPCLGKCFIQVLKIRFAEPPEFVDSGYHRLKGFTKIRSRETELAVHLIEPWPRAAHAPSESREYLNKDRAVVLLNDLTIKRRGG